MALARRPRADRLLVVLVRGLGLGVVLLCALSFTPAINRLAAFMNIEARLEPAQAIVVLGSGLNPDNTLTTSGHFRVTHAVALYRKKLSPLIVLSGIGRRGGPSWADVAARLAVELGVPGDAIVTEGGGRTTREEASRIAALLGPRGIRRVLLVSDGLHLLRALPLFQRTGLEPLPAPVNYAFDEADSPEERWRILRFLAEGTLAWLYYRLVGYI